MQNSSGSPLEVPQIHIYKPKITDYLIKMLLYGPPGVGKTTMAATADLHELTQQVLMVNIEGGLLSIADAQAAGLPDIPDVTDLEDYAQLDKIFWFLAKGKHPYRTVAIDTLSELQMINLEGVVASQVSSNSKRTDIDDIWQDDYGRSTSQLRRVLRNFRNLPMHVIFVCAEASKQDKAKNEQVFPAITPKLRQVVIGYMDIVGYMYMDTEVNTETQTERTVRKLLCRPYDRWLAKDRSPGQRLGMVVEEPSIPKIIDLIMGKAN